MNEARRFSSRALPCPVFIRSAFMHMVNYRSEARNLTMEKLASCIDKNIAEMSDDGNTNPNWNNVFENQKLGNLVNWAFFNLK